MHDPVSDMAPQNGERLPDPAAPLGDPDGGPNPGLDPIWGPAAGDRPIDVLRFRGSVSDLDYDWRSDVDGPPGERIGAAVELIRQHLGFDMTFLGPRRRELDRLPAEALREALANAVAHRCYGASSGQAIQVAVAPDGVTVYSPGPFGAPVPGGGPEAGFRVSAVLPGPRPVNPELARGLAESGAVTGDGGGLGRIRSAMLRGMRPPPRMETTAGSVKLVLPTGVKPGGHPGPAPDAAARAWVLAAGAEHGLEPGDHPLLLAAACGEWVTTDTAQELADPPESAQQAVGRLRRMAGLGLLESPPGERLRWRAGRVRPPGCSIPLTESETGARRGRRAA